MLMPITKGDRELISLEKEDSVDVGEAVSVSFTVRLLFTESLKVPKDFYSPKFLA